MMGYVLKYLKQLQVWLKSNENQQALHMNTAVLYGE